jgi:dTDP-4-dehydrorhamnose 3,5-epimerase
MKVTRLRIPDVAIVEPAVFGDDRGFFFESFSQRRFEEALEQKMVFVQDNHSRSAAGVLRGLHYQITSPQGKLVRVVSGEIFDVAVDIRRNSPTFGSWVAEILSAENKKQMWVPEGFAHGFLVMSESAEVIYKTTDYYDSKAERAIAWNDPTLAISWPLRGDPILSTKDSAAVSFKAAEVF